MTQQLDSVGDHFSLAWRGLRLARPGKALPSGAAGLQVEELLPQKLPEDVIALLDSMVVFSLQQGHAWLLNFAENVVPERHLARVFVLRRDGKVIVVLPVFLIIDRSNIVIQIEALANYYSAIYSPALHDDAGMAEVSTLLAAILTRYPSIASFRFSPMNPDLTAYDTIKAALAAAGLLAFPFFAFGNWYRKTAGLTWDAMRDVLPGRLKSTLSRRGKKFASAGGRFEIIVDGPQLEAGMAAYLAVYASSWKVPEPYLDFMPGLIRLCSARKWLRLGVAWLGDKPVAAQVWFVAHGRAEIYKLAYDEAYAEYSAGSLLSAKLFAHALDHDRVEEIDYLIGDDLYKQDWLDQRRERWGLIAYNPRTLGGLVGACRESAGRILKLLKLRPA